MRILHLIPTLSGGGAERQLALLAPAIAYSGCDIGVAFHTGGPNLELLKSGKAEILPLPKRSHYSPLQLWDILSLVRSWKPDIIQTWLTQMDILGGSVARLTGIPHVISERSAAKNYTEGWKSKTRIAIAKTASAIIANSQGGADYWRMQRVGDKIIVIPNAIRALASDPPEHPWDGKCYIVSAGRQSPEKNQLTATKAMLAALEELPTVHAVIIGEGPDRSKIAKVISQSKVSLRVQLLEYTSHLDVWLRHAAAFVSASYVEGHPNIVMEAAKARCPMILSHIPAHIEAIGLGAKYAATDDVEGFTRAIVSTISDPDAAILRATIAHERTEPLNLDAIAAQYMGFYKKIYAATLSEPNRTRNL